MSVLQRKLGEPQDVGLDAVDTGAAPVATAQRVRVGLTVLAAIFLIVLVATAGLRPPVSRGVPQAPDEPLAVLGVAPTAPDVRPPAAATSP
jgi:hypothetical protein